MKKLNQALQEKPVRVYHLQQRFSHYYFAFLWSLFALLGLALFIDDFFIDIIPRYTAGMPWYGGIIFPFGVIISVFLVWKNYWRARNTRLCIYPWGIHYDEFEYNVTTTWDNIKNIEPRPGQGLRLKEGVEMNMRFPWMGKHLESQKDYMPLWPFKPPEIGNDLERDLRKYLPHLFNGLSTKKSEK
jgi:hypothetical protein